MRYHLLWPCTTLQARVYCKRVDHGGVATQICRYQTSTHGFQWSTMRGISWRKNPTRMWMWQSMVQSMQQHPILPTFMQLMVKPSSGEA